MRSCLTLNDGQRSRRTAPPQKRPTRAPGLALATPDSNGRRARDKPPHPQGPGYQAARYYVRCICKCMEGASGMYYITYVLWRYAGMGGKCMCDEVVK